MNRRTSILTTIALLVPAIAVSILIPPLAVLMWFLAFLTLMIYVISEFLKTFSKTVERKRNEIKNKGKEN